MLTTSRVEVGPTLLKVPTGIRGLDEITRGGLPKARPTLVCGSAGCGKTLFAMEFLVRGTLEFNEPGVFISFEETGEELARNVSSLGFDVGRLCEEGKLAVDYVHVERSDIEETGEYDLEGLFIRIQSAVDTVGARRIAIDALEALFSGFTDENILRAEIRRLFRWLKSHGLTAVVTAERGTSTLTRHGLEEYVSDCVIALDNRVQDHVSTRHVRVVKYRGSSHGTDEYPFLIERTGFSVLPVRALQMDHHASTERVPTGIPTLDEMLGGTGFYRGSSILVSGSAGTGKTSMAAHFVDAACARGEKAVFISFEESMEQVARNMASIGVDLRRWVDAGLLRFHSTRSTYQGLENHLVDIHRVMDDFAPRVAVIDPLTTLQNAGEPRDVQSMVERLIDYLKERQITAFMTSLTQGGSAQEQSEVGISSAIDAWLVLRNLETAGERTRGLFVIKARGMRHSNQIREFLMTDDGVKLVDVYMGADGVLTGSARAMQEARERDEAQEWEKESARRRRDLERRRAAMEAQVLVLRAEFEAEREVLEHDLDRELRREREVRLTRAREATVRQDSFSKPKGGGS